MAALWGVIEITVGGMIKPWRVPFGGALLASFGVVILLTARANVPGRWSTLLVGIVAAGIRFTSGFAAAQFAAIGIIVEALIVELVLTFSPRQKQAARMLAGILAVLWALVHPFLVQGYIAGIGPATMYRDTIGRIAGSASPGAGQALLVLFFLIVVHTALGVSAVLFVDKILLAPGRRAGVPIGRKLSGRGRHKSRPPGSGGAGGGTAAGIVAIAAALLLAAAPGARAQDAGPSLGAGNGAAETTDAGAKPIYALPEITVFGSRLFGPYSVFEIDEGDIQDVGADNLAEALELVPGMVVRTDSRGEARLSTRGLGEREMVVTVDGVPISDPYTGSVSSQMVLSGAMGAVNVTKGPAASVYGANAIGGVVAVTTAGLGRTGIGFQLVAGNDGRYSGYVTGSGSVGPVHLSGGVAANSRSDFTLPESYEPEDWEDGGTRDYSSGEELLLWSNASWGLGENADASVSVQVADGRRDVPASTSSSRPRYWRFPYWREVRTIGSVDWRPDEFLFVEGKLFYGTNNNQLAAYSDFDRTDPTWLSTVSNEAYGGYFFSEYLGIEGHKLSAGLNLREDIAGLQRDVELDWNQYESTTMSLFGQDVFRLGKSNRVALALNTDLMAGEERFLVSVNPQASWSRALPAGYGLRLLGGLKTRFPTLKEWFSPEIGNPDLRPEKCAAVEAELSKRTTAGSRFSLLLFEQWVRDMIVTSGWGEPARNLGSVTSWGAEFGAEHHVTRDFRVDVSLALTSARDDDTKDPVPLVPRTTGAVGASYRHGPYQAIARVARVGARSDGRGGSLPAHVLTDLRGVVETRWGNFFAGVENLFDVLYEDEIGFPQPGRRFEVGVMRDLYTQDP
jgi:iron complex outermembrane receptor protein/outer membrane receptor for ferrienterochelin and colicins